MSSATTAPPAVAYTIDASHSSVGFKIRHFMVNNFRGGFSGIAGDVVFDSSNPANTKINATIDAATLHTHDARRDAHVKGPDFLDVDKFPTITFVSKQVTPDGHYQWKILGDLTMHGVTKEVTLDCESAEAESKDPWGRIRSGASAETTIKRSDFGLTSNVVLETGGVMLSDDVHIHIDIELLRKA